ncbi:hypothetical protein PVAP13_5KG476107, partial [Panicum virgatum]
PPDPPNLPTRLRDTDVPSPNQSHPHPSELPSPAISFFFFEKLDHVLPGSAQPRIRLAANPPSRRSRQHAAGLATVLGDFRRASGKRGNERRRKCAPAIGVARGGVFSAAEGGAPRRVKAIRRAPAPASVPLSLVPSAHPAIPPPLPPRPFPLRRAARPPAAGFRGRAPRPSKRHPRAPPPVADQGVSADVTLRDLTAGPRAARAFQLTPQQLGAGRDRRHPQSPPPEERRKFVLFFLIFFLPLFLSPDAPI